MTLNELFKNTTYDDTLFSVEDKSTIESRIFMKSVRGSEVPYITCAIRDKEIKLTPEEAVRQLYIYKLMNDYGYAASRIQLETPIPVSYTHLDVYKRQSLYFQYGADNQPPPVIYQSGFEYMTASGRSFPRRNQRRCV